MKSVEVDLDRVKRRSQATQNKLDGVLNTLESDLDQILDSLIKVEASQEDESEKMIEINSILRKQTEKLVSKKPLSSTKAVHKDYFTYLSHLGKTIDKNLKSDLQTLSEYIRFGSDEHNQTSSRGPSPENRSYSGSKSSPASAARVSPTSQDPSLPNSQQNTRLFQIRSGLEHHPPEQTSDRPPIPEEQIGLLEIVKKYIEESSLVKVSVSTTIQNHLGASKPEETPNLVSKPADDKEASDSLNSVKETDISVSPQRIQEMAPSPSSDKPLPTRKQETLKAYILMDNYLKQGKSDESLGVMTSYIKSSVNPHPTDLEILKLLKQLHFWTLMSTSSPKAAINFIKENTNVAGANTGSDLTMEDLGCLLHLATYKGAANYPMRLSKYDPRHLLAKTLATTNRRVRKMHNLDETADFRMAILAGVIALPCLLQHKHILEEANGDRELQVGVQLPKDMQHHSIIQCPITREICGVQANRPMLQGCGHIIGETSVNKMMETANCKATGSFKCPTCPNQQKPDTLRHIVY